MVEAQQLNVSCDFVEETCVFFIVKFAESEEEAESEEGDGDGDSGRSTCMKQSEKGDSRFLELIGAPFTAAEFDVELLDCIPEISMDPETKLLSLINSHTALKKNFVISLTGSPLPLLLHSSTGNVDEEFNKQGVEMIVERESKGNVVAGDATDSGVKRNIAVRGVTIIGTLPPSSIVDVGFMEQLPAEETNPVGVPELCSDVRLILEEEVEKGGPPHMPALSFPLEAVELRQFLCAQGFGGCFTHLFPENYYSVDFVCEKGTNVVAALDGVILDIRDEHKSRGCHVNNFYSTNYLSVKHQIVQEGKKPVVELVSEYVHIEKGSANKLGWKVGDCVKEGMVIARSGNSGFSPKPHLHFQLNLGTKSIPFVFKCSEQLDAVSTFPNEREKLETTESELASQTRSMVITPSEAPETYVPQVGSLYPLSENRPESTEDET